MKKLLVIVASLLPLTATAQNPLHHFTDAVDQRYSMSQPVISYTLRVDQNDLSAYAVEMRIRNARDTVRFAMAAHPEYDDRYWRYVEGLRVEGRDGVVPVAREDSAIWRVVVPGGVAVIRYRIKLPAAESPRAAWRPFLSPTGALVGGPHSFMYVLGATLAPSHVVLDLPAGWEIATGLTPTADPKTFFAASVDALVDSPVFAGRLHSWRFAIDAVPHRIVYWPAPNATPFDTLAFARGIESIARQAVNLFGRASYRDYTFIFQDNAYGGLEHRNSVTLGAPSEQLARGLADVFEETAHEFTHTWNLMRLRPAEYQDVSPRTQPPVAGLWWSEGLTLYYTDLFLRRAGLPVSDSTRIVHLELILGRYLNNPGYARFSAERISQVAYNASPGVLGDYSPSVHLVGEVLGAVLDLIVRDATSNRRSVDDVMRLLLERHSAERGFTGADIERATSDVCECNVKPFFDAHVRGANAIDFERYLRLAGLRLTFTRAPARDDQGKPVVDLRAWAYEPPNGARLRMVVTNPSSSFGRAGLHSNDELVSINGKAMTTWRDVRMMLTSAKIGDTLRFEVARPSGPFRTSVVMSGFDRISVRLDEMPDATPRQRAVREGILSAALKQQ